MNALKKFKGHLPSHKWSSLEELSHMRAVKFKDVLEEGRSSVQAPVIPLLRSRFSLAQSCPGTVARQAPLSMDFPGKNTGMGSYFLLQGSSQPRDQICVSCISSIDMWILYPDPPGKPQKQVIGVQTRERGRWEFVAWSTPCFLPKQALPSPQ